jgi:hypothetical protein
MCNACEAVAIRTDRPDRAVANKRDPLAVRRPRRFRSTSKADSSPTALCSGCGGAGGRCSIETADQYTAENTTNAHNHGSTQHEGSVIVGTNTMAELAAERPTFFRP